MSEGPERTLLHNCVVVDAERDEPLLDAAILIEGDRIAAVGPMSEVTAAPAADGARPVDLGGGFVSPGLVNMHTHLSLTLPGPRGAAVKQMNPFELVLYMADGARRCLESGVTTIRCVGEREHADFALRAAIISGWVAGPRIYTAGRPLTATGGHGHSSSGALECDGPVEFTRGARQQIRAGADLIKAMISGGISGQHETITTRQVTTEELAAVISTAHDWRKKVTAHAGPAPLIAEAVELGLDCVEHGYELTDEVTDAMAARGCALVPTLVVTRCKEFFDEIGVPEWMQQRSLSAGERHMQAYKSALSSGVEILLGSDMPPFWHFEGTTAVVRELEHMSKGGLGAVGTMRAATLGPCQWLDIDADLGTVAPGKLADIIVTAESPMVETSAYRTISWVMKGGRVVRDDRDFQHAVG